MVRTVKACLRRILGKAALTAEELTTVLQEVEAVINSRPLTYLSAAPTDSELLTPAHFLIGRRLIAIPAGQPVPSESTRSEVTRRWLHRKRLAEHFWRRWRKEYLLHLRSFHHSKNMPTHELKVGDLVLVHEDKAPRQMWKTGRILEVIVGRD